MEKETVTNRNTEELRLWLFDLSHGDLEDNAIIKGFIKHYALYGLAINNVKDDIWFHTNYGAEGAKTAMISLEKALQNFVN